MIVDIQGMSQAFTFTVIPALSQPSLLTTLVTAAVTEVTVARLSSDC